MEWKPFVIGAAIGLVGGYAVKEIVSQKVHISPEKVLENVKKQFKLQGKISGSWIQMKAVPYKKEQLSYEVYKGGISKFEDGEQKQYEFIADANTGTIIDVFLLGV